MSVAGLTCVRNEVDTVEFSIYHHLNQGVDKIYVVDNGSTDGTTEILERIVSADSRVRFFYDDGPYRHAEYLTNMAAIAHADGMDWILVFDADEVWTSSTGTFSDLQSVSDSIDAIKVQPNNYVQSYNYDLDRIFESVDYRIPVQDTKVSVPDWMSEKNSYVEISWTPKLIIRSCFDLYISMGAHWYEGNHLSTGDGQSIKYDARFKCAHVPLRSRESIFSKVELGKRLIDSGVGPASGIESQHWYNLYHSGEDIDQWKFNSQVDGVMPRENLDDLKLSKDLTVSNSYKNFLLSGGFNGK